MTDRTAIHEFAKKWCDKFRDPKINYTELVDHFMADDCEALGFKMDRGRSFKERYGKAVHDYEALDSIIDEIEDIQLLGSAIYSMWRYFNHWAYSGKEILSPASRAWFILALSRLANLTGANPFIFQGTLQKIRIVSNEICYGPCPEPDDEVEQHLTINAEGYVWFSSYILGDIPGKYQKVRSRNFKIDQAVADKIFRAFSSYFSNEYIGVIATDIGDWKMELTNSERKTYHFVGALCSDFDFEGEDLSDLIRDGLGMSDLYVFDGNNKPDKITRICVDYHRITKIKPKQPISETVEYVTWDYSEKLTLDRKSETLEHIQNVGTGCTVSRKMYVEEGIKKLLDRIDPDKLFGEIEGNPDDVIVNPLETQEYTITVDFQKAPQRIIQGTYDKKALPEFWGEFANDVCKFIRFYGFGEIFDPSIYGRVKRRRQDYIYCSVEFDEGYKNYYYITDDDSITVGDYVIVPAGKDNHHAVAEVVKVDYFSESDVPFPVNKTKRIIRKCTDDDFDSPDLMTTEQLSDCTVDQLRNKVTDDDSEKVLAAVYADVHNKTSDLMHALDDEDCTFDIKQQFEEWSALEKELCSRIIEILKRENETEFEQTDDKNSGYYSMVKHFMLRNGYKDGQGWWIQ